MEHKSSPDAWQYRIGAERTPDAIPVGDLFLSVGPGLEVCRLSDAGGGDAGLLLGFPIDLRDEAMARGDIRLDRGPGDDPDDLAAHVLMRFAGRYVWIRDAPGGPRLYLDSTGQVPCVYDPAARRAGASADSILDDTEYAARFDRELFEGMDVDHAGWAVAGLTMHEGVHRLMPNFYLDLKEWRAVRHWPGPAGMPPVLDPETAIAEFIELIRTQYRVLLSDGRKLAVALTAGQDTRMLLACARPYLDRIEFVTVAGGDTYSRDTIMAHRIATGEGLTHFDLPRVKAPPEGREAYLRRGGHVVADSNADYFPSVHPIAGTHYMVGGAGGAIARGFSWSPAGNAQGKPTAMTVMKNLGLDTPPKALRAMERWLDEVPTQTSNQTMDLAYIEHRMGHWAGPQFPSDPELVRIHPFLPRRGVDLMLGLPDDWKLGKRLSGEVLRQAWPELAAYPVNSLGRWTDFIHQVHRVMGDPGMVRRRIVKRLRRV